MEQQLPDAVAKALADVKVIVTLPVFWGDMDSLGHVNNIIYFRWFESARIEYFNRLSFSADATGGQLGPILAAATCNFRRQSTFPDSVSIGARMARMGKSSFTLEHQVYSHAQSAIVADGSSTIVTFDYSTNKSHPMPEPFREAARSLEGRDIPS